MNRNEAWKDQRARGFSLVEVLISLAVVGVMAAAATALLVQQQRALQNSAGDRAMQETVRTALADMGVNLRRAGYGIEPALAFDFGPLNFPAQNPPVVTQSYLCGAAVTCRDQIAGPDEVVFYSRDPSFSRLATAVTTNTVTVAGGLVFPLYQGQVLQVMCQGAGLWAYVTVGGFVAAGAGAKVIPLGADSGTGAFPAQNSVLANACFNAGNVLVFKVDRFRYHVARFPEPGVAPPGRPYLMLDRGLFDAGGNPLDEPVAADVEDLQVSYVFPNSTTGAVQPVGGTTGTALANAPTGIDLAVNPTAFADPDDAVTRLTQSPANIRAVRIAVVARTPGSDIRLQDSANLANVRSLTVGNQIPAAGNRPAMIGDSNHHRVMIETTEVVRNLDSRAPYYPFYSTNNGADGLNVGGG
jgi:type IV pilus assembly protein PilW